MFTRHTIFQNSLLTALLDGIYDGEMTISELLGKGNLASAPLMDSTER